MHKSFVTVLCLAEDLLRHVALLSRVARVHWRNSKELLVLHLVEGFTAEKLRTKFSCMIDTQIVVLQVR